MAEERAVAEESGDPSGAADGSAELQAATPARAAMMASPVLEAGCLRSTASSSDPRPPGRWPGHYGTRT